MPARKTKAAAKNRLVDPRVTEHARDLKVDVVDERKTANNVRLELSKQLSQIAVILLGAGGLLSMTGNISAEYDGSVRWSALFVLASLIAGMTYVYKFSSWLSMFADNNTQIIREINDKTIRTIPQLRKRKGEFKHRKFDLWLLVQLFTVALGVIIPFWPDIKMMGAYLMQTAS